MKIELRISDVGITLDTGQGIWESARDLLAKYGIAVTHPRLRRDLKGKNGIEFHGNRAIISPELFALRYPSPITLAERRKAQPPAPSAPEVKAVIGINSGGFSMDVIDWRTAELRPAKGKDLAESVRVVESCGSGGPYCVTPQDVPPMLRDVVTYKTCFEHGRVIRCNYYSSPKQFPWIERMHDAMGEPFDVILGVVSPLKMSDMDMDNVYDAADRGKAYPIRVVGYGLPGIGSPAILAQSAAMVMAENYGAAILLSAVFPNQKVRVGVSAGGATDFRHCNYALGAPHAFAYSVMNAHLNAALSGSDPREGVGMNAGTLHTGACLPDQQAATEKATLALLYALMGARRFECAGNLCVDDVYSLEQFMVDREIVEHTVKMVEAGAASALMGDMAGFMEEIESVMKGEAFLALPSTLRVMRAFYKPSLVFEHMKLREWQGGGSRTLRDKARERIERKLAESDFALDAARARELDQIYREAEKALA